MRTAAPLQKKKDSASTTGGGTPVSTPRTRQLAALEERANRNPQVQRVTEIGERLNSAPVQRTRDEALAEIVDSSFRNSEYLLQRIRNTNLSDLYRLDLIRTNNQGLTEDHPDYIRINPEWFPGRTPEELEKETSGQDSGRKRVPLNSQETPENKPPENKRQKTWHKEDSNEEEEEKEDLQDAEDYTWESEAEDFEEDEESLQMGVATWNVAHFSNRNIDSVMASFVEGLQEFSPPGWNLFFASLKLYLNLIKNKLKPFEGKDESTLKDKAPGIFKGLQSPDSKVQQTLQSIALIQERLQAFDPGVIADRLQELANHDWKDELTATRHDLTARLALTDRIKALKDLEAYSKSASELFKSVQALAPSKTFLERIGQEEIPGVFQTLLEGLAATRERFPKFSLVEELRRALHSFNIVEHINEMFQDNDWLDAMILQEVNDPTLLKEEGIGFEVFKGPHLISGGKNPQNEYYPLLLREDSGAEVKVYSVGTKGDMEEVDHGEKVQWNKRNDDYRPIVVYEIQKDEDSKPVWIGVVHTTPESDQTGGVAEFHRKEIYKEIRRGLDTLQELAAREGIPLIIGGDFYLTSEAVVENIENADPEVAEMGRRDRAGSLAKVRALRDSLQDLQNQEQIPGPFLAILDERIKFLKEAMKDEQVLRNFLGLTARRKFEDLGLLVAQTISGTNPKHDPLARWFDVQIADFFLYNEDFQSAAVGILKPSGGMVPLDTEDLRYSRYWQRFSDHFPVGGIFSTDWENLLEHEAFPLPKGSAEDARKLNVRNFAGRRLEEKDVAHPRMRQTLLDLMEMTRGGGARMTRMAEKYLSEILWELGGPESMPGIDEYIQAIQELEEQEGLPDEDRLFVVSPADFEPEEDEV